MADFVMALGLALAIEGLFYAAFPNLAKKMAEQVGLAPEQTLRLAGLAAAVAGVGIVWLVRHGG